MDSTAARVEDDDEDVAAVDDQRPEEWVLPRSRSHCPEVAVAEAGRGPAGGGDLGGGRTGERPLLDAVEETKGGGTGRGAATLERPAAVAKVAGVDCAGGRTLGTEGEEEEEDDAIFTTVSALPRTDWPAEHDLMEPKT